MELSRGVARHTCGLGAIRLQTSHRRGNCLVADSVFDLAQNPTCVPTTRRVGRYTGWWGRVSSGLYTIGDDDSQAAQNGLSPLFSANGT